MDNLHNKSIEFQTLSEMLFFRANEKLYHDGLNTWFRYSNSFINYIQLRFLVRHAEENKYAFKNLFKDLTNDIVDDFYSNFKNFEIEIDNIISKLLINKSDMIRFALHENFFKNKTIHPSDVNLHLVLSSFFDYHFSLKFKIHFLNKNTKIGQYLIKHRDNISYILDNYIKNFNSNIEEYFGISASSSLKEKENVSYRYSQSIIDSIKKDNKFAETIHDFFSNIGKLEKEHFIETKKSFDDFFLVHLNIRPFRCLSNIYSEDLISKSSRRSRYLFLHQLFEICEIPAAIDKNSIDQLDENKNKKDVYQDSNKRKERRIAQLVPDLK